MLDGPFSIKEYPVTHPRGRAWVAAISAVRLSHIERDLANARYDRARLMLRVNPSSEALEEELDAYLGVQNVALGTNMTAKELREQQMSRRFDLYERVTGYAIGSPELNEAVDRTINVIKKLDDSQEG